MAIDRFDCSATESQRSNLPLQTPPAVRPQQQTATAKRRCAVPVSTGNPADYFLLAGAFLAAVVRVVVFRAVAVFLAGAFLAADFVAVVFFAAGFLAAVFVAVDFRAAGFFAAGFFAAVATVVLLSVESRESAHTDIVIRLTS
jgi:hypothetical protein